MANPMTKDYGQSPTEQMKEGAGQAGDKAREAARQAGDKAKEAASTIGGKAREAASAVGEMVSTTASNVGTAVEKSADRMTAAAGTGVRHLGETIQEKGPHTGFLGGATRAVADSLQGGGKYLEQEGFTGMLEDVGQLIRRNPFPAILVGIGLGFLIGRTLRS